MKKDLDAREIRCAQSLPLPLGAIPSLLLILMMLKVMMLKDEPGARCLKGARCFKT